MKREGIGIIGCGNIGTILAESVVTSEIYPPSSVYVSDVRKEQTKKLQKTFKVVPADNKTIAEKANVIILAVKPNKVKDVLVDIKDLLTPSTLLISVAAGISIKSIEGLLCGSPVPVIRVMPNVNIKVKAGILPYCPGKYAAKYCKTAEKILSPLGVVFKLPENKFDAITAISGSGPGFLFYIAECLKQISKEKGLTERQADTITGYLFYGAGKMLVETGLDPKALKVMVTSPGGTTEAGLEVFKSKGFSQILKKVIDKAEVKSKELRKKP